MKLNLSSTSIVTKIIGVLWLYLAIDSLSYYFSTYIDKYGIEEVMVFSQSQTRAEIHEWIKACFLLIGSVFVIIGHKIGWVIYQLLVLSSILEILFFKPFFNDVMEFNGFYLSLTLVVTIAMFYYLNRKSVRTYFDIDNRLRKNSYIYFPILGTLFYFIPICFYYHDIYRETNPFLSSLWQWLFYTTAFVLVALVMRFFWKMFHVFEPGKPAISTKALEVGE